MRTSTRISRTTGKGTESSAGRDLQSCTGQNETDSQEKTERSGYLVLAPSSTESYKRRSFMRYPASCRKNPWSPSSFAYQAGLGVSNAIAEVNNIREEGYSFCITLDLSAFFDNVPHDRLLGKLKVHLKDPRVIELVKKFLTSVIAGPNGELKRTRIGTPQGSVLSPWLASTVAHRGTSGISI